MTPLPAALGGTGWVAWRLETTRHLSTWGSGQGAFWVGGRWSSVGRRVIFTALDPSAAIIEVGVHKGLDTLDVVPHSFGKSSTRRRAREILRSVTAFPPARRDHAY